MRYKILTTALLVILPLTLTACTLQDLPVVGKLFGGSSTPTTSPVTLNVWGMWENKEAFEAIASKYKELHPNVTINYDDRSVVKASSYHDTVFGRVAQEDVADIVLVHNSWVPAIKASLSAMPATLMDAATYSQTYYSVAGDSAVFDSKIYAVPAYYDGLVLVYNKQHFDAINQKTPPTAWEEFRRLALLLTVKSEKDALIRGGAAIGTANNVDFFSDILGLMFAQAKISIPQDIDSKPAQDALSFYTIFSMQDHVWDSSFPEAAAAFAQERVSMIFVPSWALLDILKVRPDLQIGVAPVPQVDSQNPVTWGSFWMYAVPSKSKNQATAWDFINFISQDDQQKLLFSTASKYRTYGAPYAKIDLQSALTSSAVGIYLKPLLDSAPYAKSGLLTARAGNDLYVNALKDAVMAVTATSNDRKTPAEALKAAKAVMLGGATTTSGAGAAKQ